MKQSEFVELLAKNSDTTVKHAAIIVEAFWELVTKTLKKGDEVVFKHGKFVLKKKPAMPARDGINPFTKEPIKIAAKPASVQPLFKPGKKFKDDVKK